MTMTPPRRATLQLRRSYVLSLAVMLACLALGLVYAHRLWGHKSSTGGAFAPTASASPWRTSAQPDWDMVGNPTHVHPPAPTPRPPELAAADAQRRQDAQLFK